MNYQGTRGNVLLIERIRTKSWMNTVLVTIPAKKMLFLTLEELLMDSMLNLPLALTSPP